MTKSQKEDEAIRRAINGMAAMLGKNHDEMAKLLNTSRSTLNRWIAEPGRMSLSDYRRVNAACDKLGISIQAMMEKV